jgi:hypothetical protein
LDNFACPEDLVCLFGGSCFGEASGFCLPGEMVAMACAEQLICWSCS